MKIAVGTSARAMVNNKGDAIVALLLQLCLLAECQAFATSTEVLQETTQALTREKGEFERWCNGTLLAQRGRRSALRQLLAQAQSGYESSFQIEQLRAEAADASEAVEKARAVLQADSAERQRKLVATQFQNEDASRDAEALRRAQKSLRGHGRGVASDILDSLLAEATRTVQASRRQTQLLQSHSSDIGKTERLEKYHKSKEDSISSLQLQIFTTQRSLDVLTAAVEDESAYLADLQTVCGISQRVFRRMETDSLVTLQQSLKRVPPSASIPATTHVTSHQSHQEKTTRRTLAAALKALPVAPTVVTNPPTPARTQVPEPTKPRMDVSQLQMGTPPPQKKDLHSKDFRSTPKQVATTKAMKHSKSTRQLIPTRRHRLHHRGARVKAQPASAPPPSKGKDAADSHNHMSLHQSTRRKQAALSANHDVEDMHSVSSVRDVEERRDIPPVRKGDEPSAPSMRHVASSAHHKAAEKQPAPSVSPEADDEQDAVQVQHTVGEKQAMPPYQAVEEQHTSQLRHVAGEEGMPSRSRSGPDAVDHERRAQPQGEDDVTATQAKSSPVPALPKRKPKGKASFMDGIYSSAAGNMPSQYVAWTPNDGKIPEHKHRVDLGHGGSATSSMSALLGSDDSASLDDPAEQTVPPSATNSHSKSIVPPEAPPRSAGMAITNEVAGESGQTSVKADDKSDDSHQIDPQSEDTQTKLTDSDLASPAESGSQHAAAKGSAQAPPRSAGMGSTNEVDGESGQISAKVDDESDASHQIDPQSEDTQTKLTDTDVASPAESGSRHAVSKGSAQTHETADAVKSDIQKDVKADFETKADEAQQDMKTEDTSDKTLSVNTAKEPGTDSDAGSVTAPRAVGTPMAVKLDADDDPDADAPSLAPAPSPPLAPRRLRANDGDGSTELGKPSTEGSSVGNPAPSQVPTQYAAWTPNDAAAAAKKKEAVLAQMEADFDDDSASTATTTRAPPKHRHRRHHKSTPAPMVSKHDDDANIMYDDDDLPKHHHKPIMAELSGGWRSLMARKTPKAHKAKLDPDIAVMQSLYTADGGLPSQYTAWTPGGEGDGGPAPGDSFLQLSSLDEMPLLPVLSEADDRARIEHIIRSTVGTMLTENGAGAVRPSAFLEQSVVRADAQRALAARIVLQEYAAVLHSQALQQLARAKPGPSKLKSLWQRLSAVDPLSHPGAMAIHAKQAQAEQWCAYFQKNEPTVPVHQALVELDKARASLANMTSQHSAISEEMDARVQLQRTVQQDVQGLTSVLGILRHGTTDGLDRWARNLTSELSTSGAKGLLSLGEAVEGIREGHVELADALEAALHGRSSVLKMQKQKLAGLQEAVVAKDNMLLQLQGHVRQAETKVESLRRKLVDIGHSCDNTLRALEHRRHSGHMEARAVEMALKVLGSSH